MDYRRRLSFLYLGPDRHAWLSAPNLLTLADAWAACPCGEWMFSVLSHMHPFDPGSAVHITMVRALCDCMELAFHLVPAEKVVAYREVLDVVRAWTRRDATDEDVSQIRSALESDSALRPYNSVLTAIRWAAYSVKYRSLSGEAVRLVASEVRVVARPDHAGNQPTSARCADIVRQYFPTPPRMEIRP